MTTNSTVKLSTETAAALDALAKRFHIDRTEMVERLVFGTARTVTPSKEKS